MASTAITSTPKDLYDAFTFIANDDYSIQNSGDYEIWVHEDPVGTLTEDTVIAAAGSRPYRILPRSKLNNRYQARANHKLWAWTPGLPSAIAVVREG